MSPASIKINPDLCKKCGLCIYFCPQKVLTGAPGELPKVQTMEKCAGCLACFDRCPDFAIEVEVLRS